MADRGSCGSAFFSLLICSDLPIKAGRGGGPTRFLSLSSSLSSRCSAVDYRRGSYGWVKVGSFATSKSWLSEKKRKRRLQTNFGTPSLYDLIQRQNQLNNALLYNHVLINNQMAAGLQDNHLHTPPTYPPFPQQPPTIPPLLYPPHMQGLLPHNLATNSAEKLAIFGALSPMTSPKSAEIPLPLPAAPVVSGVVQLPVSKDPNNELLFLAAATNKKDPEKDPHEDSNAILKIKAIGKASTVAATTIGPVELLPTTSSEQQEAINIHNAYNYLKNLNLTENESEKLVHIVEQVVREELARKLATESSSAATSPSTLEVSTPASTSSVTGASIIVEESTAAAEEESIPGEEALNFAGPTAFSIDRSGRLIDTELPEIKLHPPKKTEDKDGSYPGIKTSETHLTAIEERVAEDEDRDASKKDQGRMVEVTSVTEETTTAEATTTREEFDPKKVRPIPRRSFLETDSDLLALATGAPLDLSDETAAEEASYRNRFRATKPPAAPRLYTKTQQIPRLRPSTPPTQFVRLAEDYRQRLSGTEDVTNLLKKFYENAYVQLVANEANPRKISKPQQLQYSPGR